MSKKKEKDKKDLTVSKNQFGTDISVGTKTTRHKIDHFGNETDFVTKYSFMR